MEKDYPKISVVTPSFNQGEFLERTIESVLNQGYPNLEYLIIDGGSTDDSVEIIKKYESNLSYWVSEKDSGQTDAINKGLKRITGDVWTYLCSDDTYVGDVFFKVAEIFQKNPEYGVVYGGTNFVNENDIVTRIKYPGEFRRERLLRGNYLYQPSMFMHKNLIKEHGLFSEELHYGMDYEYWLRLSDNTKFYYVKDIFSNYRLHSDSKSMDRVVDMVRESSDIRKEYGAGIIADLDYLKFKFFGNYYYKLKRKFFNWLKT